jgi:hypothetical protein
MAFLNVIQRIEFKTIQDFLKSEPFHVRPKHEHGEIVLVMYYEDAYKDLIEVGRINKPVDFFSTENFGNKSIEDWVESHVDEVIPSGIFKNN